MNELENAENGPTLDTDLVSDLIFLQSQLQVPKTREAKHYKYRSAEDILQAIKPLLEDRGCTLQLTDEVITHGKGDLTRFYVKTTVTLIDSVKTVCSAIGLAREPAEHPGMDASQLTGSAASYAAKRALGNLFLLDDSIDPDGTMNMSEEEAKEFTVMVDKKEGAKLFMLKREDPERFKALMNKAAPVGSKTQFKNLVGELTFDAYAQSKKAADAIRELLPKGDAYGVKEVFEEMDHDETRILWMQFSEEQRTDIRNLKELLKE